LTYNLERSACRFDPGKGTYKVVNKEGLSDETKNRGPLNASVYARASKRSYTGGQ
jgi:hypothetical protein